jgi:hypothetical protein
MAYREIRVRPVVRYIVTDFECDAEFRSQSSTGRGEFDNARAANHVAKVLAEHAGAHSDTPIHYEPARQLKIGWLRGPGEPQEAIRWELLEEEDR